MEHQQSFTIDENDLKQIIIDLLDKKGLKLKDDKTTVSINTNKNSVDGPIEIGRTWGFMESGVVIYCEVENK